MQKMRITIPCFISNIMGIGTFCNRKNVLKILKQNNILIDLYNVNIIQIQIQNIIQIQIQNKLDRSDKKLHSHF